MNYCFHLWHCCYCCKWEENATQKWAGRQDEKHSKHAARLFFSLLRSSSFPSSYSLPGRGEIDLHPIFPGKWTTAAAEGAHRSRKVAWTLCFVLISINDRWSHFIWKVILRFYFNSNWKSVVSFVCFFFFLPRIVSFKRLYIYVRAAKRFEKQCNSMISSYGRFIPAAIWLGPGQRICVFR